MSVKNVDGAMATFCQAQPPPAPPSSKTNGNGNNQQQQVSLEFILETFQSNISQEQAWALIYQSTKTLNQLILSEYGISRSSKSTTTTELSLKKLTSFSQIIIDINGNVTTSTWMAPSSSNDGQQQQTLILMKSDDKRLMNESINALIASLATMVYTALEWNWRQSSSSSSSSSSSTTCCNVAGGNHHNHRRHQNEDGEIFKCQTTTSVSTEDDDDDDEELDLEESLELLMLSMVRGSENKDLVDEGYIDALEESCLHSVLVKCQSHFDELIASSDDHHHHPDHHHNDDDHHHNQDEPGPDKIIITTNKGNNAILEMLSSSNVNKLGADYYYRTVCKMMVDEALKLNKLVNQFCDRQVERFKTAELITTTNNTENLKIWAQTWIKVMSEMRFGVLLRPVQIETKKSVKKNSVTEILTGSKKNLRNVSKNFDLLNSQRYYSLPIITEDSILERLKNLKPVSIRKIREPIPEPPCLHERLMIGIRQFDRRQLRPTQTRVKPVIRELYLREKQRRMKESCRSLWNLNSNENGSFKRKNRTPDGKKQLAKQLPLLMNLKNHDLVYSETSLNKIQSQDDRFNNKKKHKRTLNEYSSYHHRTSTPKLNSCSSSIDFLSNKNLSRISGTKTSFDDIHHQESLNSYQSLSLVTTTNYHHHESSYCIVGSSLFRNSGSSRSNFSTSNPYLRRSFVRKSSDHHNRQNRTASISINQTDEDDEPRTGFDFPPRTSPTRRSFRSSLNVVWCRLFGGGGNGGTTTTKSNDMIKKQV